MRAAAPLSSPESTDDISLNGGKYILFYDGVCVMCNDFIRSITEDDTGDVFRFAPLQSQFARRVLARHGHNADDMDSMYIVIDYGSPQERIVWKYTALTFVMSHMPGIQGWVGRLLAWIPTSLGDTYYERRARSRYDVYGKYDACPVPRPDIRRRLLALE
ncbi:thiol-disulfide oxidoreductase DCC family protein [Melittangium boletus]|uniref:Thiol-disulfide oxidoreductase n=1 Tax=Melittangium boletus DSM 14713 TaxID=1294270 RepID=A0A250IJ24_9BACT|nr:DCC1-like thiol-disulfide oxidoreductase family protein [Melittangium boletus]ATB31220.1 hypothetical protein MEBOL_004682 [Melittangium boletus DSM 14713]